MHVLRPTEHSARIAAVTAAVGFLGIAVFQLALAAGAPLGAAAWGGANAGLSAAERIGSAVAVFVWTGAALVVLGRAGLWAAGKHSALFRRGTWVLAAVSVIAALMNFASPSHWENAIFGPTALVLAVLCAIVARGDPGTRLREPGKRRERSAAVDGDGDRSRARRGLV